MPKWKQYAPAYPGTAPGEPITNDKIRSYTFYQNDATSRKHVSTPDSVIYTFNPNLICMIAIAGLKYSDLAAHEWQKHGTCWSAAINTVGRVHCDV